CTPEQNLQAKIRSPIGSQRQTRHSRSISAPTGPNKRSSLPRGCHQRSSVMPEITLTNTLKEQQMTSAKQWQLTGWLLSAVLCFTTALSAQDQAPESPLVKQINNGNWLDPKEAETLVDELYYQHAIYAYMTMLPALNVIGMRDGSEKLFGVGYNVLPIWKERMDARAMVPTPNADVIYSMSYLDLKKTGPLVVKAPPNVIGMFTDFFQRTITDVGAIGPDRARGGLYLLLPPDYNGPIPASYFAFNSSTYNLFLF